MSSVQMLWEQNNEVKLYLFGKSMGCFLSCKNDVFFSRTPTLRKPSLSRNGLAQRRFTVGWQFLPFAQTQYPFCECIPLCQHYLVLQCSVKFLGGQVPTDSILMHHSTSWWTFCTTPLLSASVTRMSNYPTRTCLPEHERWTYQLSALS
jgi:hypothetical protein